MNVRTQVLKARKALLNGGGKLSYFEDRGLTRDTIAQAFVGYKPEVYFPAPAKASPADRVVGQDAISERFKLECK
jgi:hypothetical protein